jgi:hypothetical protein
MSTGTLYIPSKALQLCQTKIDAGWLVAEILYYIVPGWLWSHYTKLAGRTRVPDLY